MLNAFTRSSLVAAMQAFVQAWQTAETTSQSLALAADVELISSHRATAQGRTAVTAWLMEESSTFDTRQIGHSNHVVAALEGESVVGAYFYGSGSRAAGEALAFGGLLLLSLVGPADAPYITRIQIQMNWMKGDLSLACNWKAPVMHRLWEPGDAEPVIVSELDAPWRRLPQSAIALSDEEAIADAWYRYAWALDQADYSLFDTAFTGDATAELTPMGTLRGKHALMGTLKAFRMPWPWMKHYGEPISIEHDGTRATMVLGRLIPGRTHADSGKRLYGAHYTIEARKLAKHGWRISEMRYVPGWVEVA